MIDSPPSKMSTRAGLEALFLPRSIALVGATDRPGTVGRNVLSNLLANESRITVYAVNPSRDEILGVKTHKRVSDLPSGIDLAIVVTPAQTVPDIIVECVDS